MLKILYLGLDPSHLPLQGEVTHYPLIKIVPKTVVDSWVLKEFASFTHVVFTSKSAVPIFFTLFKGMSLKDKRIISVGKITKKTLFEQGIDGVSTVTDECQEGIIDLLDSEDLTDAYFLFPSSALARPLLRQFLDSRKIPYLFCPIYETKALSPHPLPDLEAFDAVVFTSPSTVEAFFALFSTLPLHLRCIAQGEVSKKMIVKLYKIEAPSILVLNPYSGVSNGSFSIPRASL